MAIKTYQMGPGTLSLKVGAAAAVQVESQLRSFTCTATENVTTTDAVPVLSGEELAASETVTHSWQAAGSFLQQLEAAGVVDWSWTNKGKEAAFTFIPNSTAGRKVTGTVIVVPLALGGQVKSPDPLASDFTWRGKTGQDFALGNV